jgi:autotransporter-associated beta strand protein
MALTNDVRFILSPVSAVGLYDTWDLTAVDPSRVFFYSGSVTITANNTATLPGGVAFGLGLINIGNLTTLDGALGDTAFGPPTAPLYLSGTTIKNNDNNPIFSALRTITLNAGGAAFTAGWGKNLTVLSKLTSVGGFNVNCDSGYVILSNSLNDYSGDTTIATLWNGYYGTTARLKLGASEVLPHGAGKGNLILNSGATLEMNGFSETINGLSSIAANAIVTNASVNPVVLTVGANNATSSYAGKIIGAIGFVKTGTGTVTLAAPCAYPGATTVSAGTLALDSACTLASTNVLVCRGASLSLVAAGVFGGAGSKTELLVGEAGVTLGSQGKVVIPTGIEVSVFYFGINGLFKNAGTWGASGSGAQFIDDAIFTGGGILRVLETGPQRGTVIRFM